MFNFKKKIQNKAEDGSEINEEGVIVEEGDSLALKIIKGGLAVLAMAATGVLGYLLGRNSDDDDESDTNSEQQETAEA